MRDILIKKMLDVTEDILTDDYYLLNVSNLLIITHYITISQIMHDTSTCHSMQVVRNDLLITLLYYS